MKEVRQLVKSIDEIYLAGGCFWGMQKYLDQVCGVAETVVGYANGEAAFPSPTYEDVCYRNTGHAETVKVVYSKEEIDLLFLLQLYFDAIDPTAVNRQGGDVGTQYRTGIYYTNKEQLPVIQHALAQLQRKYQEPIAVEVQLLKNFTRAEEYHQKYLDKNPGGYCHIGGDKFQRAKCARPEKTQREKLSDPALRGSLTDIQYEVTQKNGTEPPFQNEYWNHFQRGIYVDIVTGEPLFLSSDKFESGCGWPSFSRPIEKEAVAFLQDTSHGMVRTEVRSQKGNCHLGHVFDDGPLELGGKRYCINSAALRFIPIEDMEKEGYGHLLPLCKL